MNDDVNRIKDAIDIVEYISKFVELKPAGSNFKGLSPFQSEKTASFIVNSQKNIWYDFSSNQGGDVISFVCKYQGIDFKEALESLADYAGIKLSNYRQSANKDSISKTNLIKLNNTAQAIYSHHLATSKLGLDYLKNRSINKESIINFKLGLSFATSDSLYRILKKKDFNDKDILNTNLVIYNGRYFDFFRNRIMFPILDISGNTVGFTARQIIDDKNSGKYINSRESLVYNKSKAIYGYYQAKSSINKSKQAIFVEGNLDCIHLHQAGFTNVLAVSGTALTEQHLKTVKNIVNEIVLCFDNDNAGINATIKSIINCLNQGINVSVIDLGIYKDADELLVKSSSDLFSKLLKNRLSAKSFLLKNFTAEIDNLNKWLDFLSNIDNEIVINEYSIFLNSLFQIDTNLIITTLNKRKSMTKSGTNLDVSLNSINKQNINELDEESILIIKLILLYLDFDCKLDIEDLLVVEDKFLYNLLLETKDKYTDYNSRFDFIKTKLPYFNDDDILNRYSLALESISLDKVSGEAAFKQLKVKYSRFKLTKEIEKIKYKINESNNQDYLSELQDKLKLLKRY